jgi:hypothetical protein
MSPTAMQANPFMLLLHPEVVVPRWRSPSAWASSIGTCADPWTRSCRVRAADDDARRDDDEGPDPACNDR